MGPGGHCDIPMRCGGVFVATGDRQSWLKGDSVKFGSGTHVFGCAFTEVERSRICRCFPLHATCAHKHRFPNDQVRASSICLFIPAARPTSTHRINLGVFMKIAASRREDVTLSYSFQRRHCGAWAPFFVHIAVPSLWTAFVTAGALAGKK